VPRLEGRQASAKHSFSVSIYFERIQGRLNFWHLYLWHFDAHAIWQRLIKHWLRRHRDASDERLERPL
jgi:hypothetical protein